MNETEKYLKNYIDSISKYLEIKPSVEIKSKEEDSYEVNISGDDLSFLIGYRGSSLDALQHLLSLSVFAQHNDWKKVTVDINDYRDAKKSKLEDITKKYIDKVRFFNEEVALPPMNSYDRKVVHEFVGGYSDVTSSSMGEGIDRHVILKPTL